MNCFDTVYATDVGIKKQTNQDSLLIQGISNGKEEILLAVLCDGMGGIAKGELASAVVIKTFSEWFLEFYMPRAANLSIDEIKEQWSRLLTQCNEKLIGYGVQNRLQLGTTVTAMLIFSVGGYLIGHVGDTRVYLLSDSAVQLTEDHTWVARELKRGRLSREEAEKDGRRNVLLQCIGVNRNFEPQFLAGQLFPGQAALLCSDGFRHTVTDEEIYQKLNPRQMREEAGMERSLRELIETNKARNETDNITAIYVRRK